ncbi:MAG: hypothetical protein Q7U02_15270, partial [Desulfosalsimonadaceae bacterium]|nr:hypothetical protein [Desulfosalsimonadaceae bacterium]
MKQKWMVAFVMSLILAGIVFPASSSAAATLKGAETILQELRGIGAKGSADTKKPDAKAAFSKDLSNFKKNRDTTPSKEAASAWLELWDHYWSTFSPEEITESYYADYDNHTKGIPLEELIMALPSPEAWPVLKKLIKTRMDNSKKKNIRDDCLGLLLSILNGDAAGMGDRLKVIEKWMSKWESGTYAISRMDRLTAFKANLEGKDPDKETLRAFEEFLKKLEKGEMKGSHVVIPDLVSLAGEEQARNQITRLLMIPGVEFEAPSETETARLVRETALVHVDQLPNAHWSLVDSLGAVELFERLEKRFGKKDQETSPPASASMGKFGYYEPNRAGEERKKAAIYYILGLVARGDMDKAIMTAGSLKMDTDRSYTAYGAWKEAQDKVPPSVLFSFLDRLLNQHPEFPWWDMYMALGLQTGKAETAIGRIKALLQQKDVDPLAASSARPALYKGLLAVGNVDEALIQLRKKAGSLENDPSENPRSISTRFEAALTIMEIGRLLNNEKMMNEGLSLSMKMINDALEGDSSDFSRIYYSLDNLLEQLLKMNRLEEAETLMVRSLKIAIQAGKEENSRGWRKPGDFSELMILLAKLYHQADRPEDVLTLVNDYPWWGALDIKDLPGPEIWVETAWALHKKGDNEAAVKILKACMFKWQGHDPAFSLLCDISGQDAIGYFDLLYARDRFEERPLIWKSELLRRSGNLDKAETSIRQALKVDPTDGEQPAGSRVLAYKVLADILETKGNQTDAAFFKNVVKSVRIAEHGDELREAGLLSMSLKEYWEAENFFADAYCVQWRLAEQLRAKGEIDEASKHYDIVFARMPEQFGQLASLCFGCENVFGNQPSRSAAEKVLTGLLASKEKNR